MARMREAPRRPLAMGDCPSALMMLLPLREGAGIGRHPTTDRAAGVSVATILTPGPGTANLENLIFQ